MPFTRNMLNVLIYLTLTIAGNVSYAEDVSDEMEEGLADFYGDEDFVSIATGTKKAIHKAPSVATVITAEEIKAMGAKTIYEVLETVTGIHIYPSNLDRMKPNFSIRGIHTSENPQTLLLVNGVRTTYEYNGSRWEQFNVGIDLIERIEVIRGPGSAVYGADAFSGVINIITKGVNSVSRVEAGGRVGSFGTESGWLNYINSNEKLKLSANIQYTNSDGDNSRVVDSDALYGFGLGSLSNAPSPLDTRSKSLDFQFQLEYQGFYTKLWYLKDDGGTGAGAAQALSSDDNETTESKTISGGYNWEISDVFNIDTSAYYQTYDDDTKFVIFPPGMALPRAFDGQGVPTAFTVFTDGVIGRPVAHEKYYGINLISQYSGSAKHSFRTELGYRYSSAKPEEFKNFGPGVLDGTEDFRDGSLVNVRGTPYIYMFDQTRKLYFLSLQDEWQLASDWDFTAGVRYDHYSDFGSTVNPRLALVWQTWHNLTTKFLYGEAFRAPSFQELYAINNPVVLGNTDLKPEKIRTFEVAWDYRPTFDWQLTANLFSFKSKDLITYVLQDDGTSSAQNVNNQDGIGAELEVHRRVGESLELKFGYAWQNAEDGDSGKDIADAPQKTFDASVNWKYSDKLNIYLDTRWILDRERAEGDFRSEINNYNWTNLSAIYQFNRYWDAQFTIRNLFDSNAFEPSDGQIAGDYPLEKIGYWLTISYKILSDK